MKGIRLVGFVLVMLLVVGTGMAVGQDDANEASPTDDSDPQVVREIHSERTASSRTVELSDGARRLEISESPINYEDEDGDWKPIEETLTPLASGGIENGANSFDVRAPEQMGAAPVRLSEGDDWVSYRLLGQKSEGAEVEGSTATYETSNPGTTFQLSTLAGGIKEEIVLDDASQPHSFDFELEAASGLVPTLTEQGAVVFERAGEAQPFAMLPAPIITDSSAEAMPTNAVSYALEQLSNGNWKLSVDADPEWLEAPEREWPVTIDPPVVTLASLSRDCTIGSLPSPEGWKGCGYQGQQLLYAAYIQKTGEAERSFLRFTMPTLPVKSYVSEAKLSLYSPSVAENTPGVEVRRVTSAWNESLNWKYFKKSSGLWTTPGGDYTSEGAEVLTSQRGTEAGWWEFSSIELAELIGKWRVDQAQNQGLMVKSISESKAECEANSANCARRYVAFNSSAAADSTKRPKLSITYYPPAPSTSVLTSPTEGQRTARRLKLTAKWTVAGVEGVKFQYREGSKGIFRPIPAEMLRDADGNPVTEIATEGAKKTAPVYVDAAHLTPTLRSKGGPVQVRALFEGPTEVAGYSAPVPTEVNRFIGGTADASAGVGPGTLDLLTGNLGVGRTDVSVAGLEFSRTFNSRDAGQTGDKGVLGQGWKPGTPVEQAGGAKWKNVNTKKISEEIDGETYSFEYTVVTGLDGYEISFEKEGTNYITPPEAKGWKLAPLETNKLTLTEPGGNKTIFENVSGTSEYVPIAVTQTGGSGNSTQMLYKLVEEKKRLTMLIGPTTEGVNCNSETSAKTTTGCHALAFTYEPATKWGAPSGYGERLSKITYYAPGSGGPWDVAAYEYNPEGRLKEAWDPRISPALVEKYTYLAGGQIATITPPGQEPWTLQYGAIDEELANGRLISVKRPSLVASPSVAQTTIAYGVPISGSGAPYEMSAAEVAKWGQEDIPVDATAIFGPDEVPSTNPPSAYTRARVVYMDAEGQEVNAAAPAGAGTTAPSITTTETDEFGNVVRELSAQNRIRALATGAESVTRSHQLETKRLFSEDGVDLVEEWGPLHPVRLESGTTKEARFHTTIQYDLEAPTPPAGTPWPHLPTRETTNANIPGQGVGADQRVTEHRYNWTLRKRTETIVDPGGEGHLELRTRIAYDEESGLPIERSLPAKPGGGDAHTTKTIYYSAGAQASDPACKSKPEWANLPCKVLPAAQPGGGLPELLVTRYASYNALDEPTEVIESPGGKEEETRKTIKTYDAAGRLTSTKQVGGGTALTPTAIIYDKTSGLPVEQKLNCESCDTQATVTAYDTLGRPIQYSDADGNVSKATYDLLGRLATVFDGKGTQTFGYDSTTGLLTKLEDSAAGTFTAAYDADGNMIEQGLPNGLVAKTTYDEAGAPTKLSYTKVTSCTEKCIWLEESNERSIYGQILSQASLASSQQYSYDKASRLTLVKDTPLGGECTTRSYAYEGEAGKDSNRTSLTTRLPGKGGACDTTSEGSVQKYSYDAGDRLTGEVTYDAFGRTESLPGKYAGGSALATTFYSNDMVATQSQAGLTNTYQLDAVGRPRQVVQSGTKTGTEILHYALASDSTAWTERSGTWTRSIIGIGGELAAIRESSGTTSLQLTNLHGDVVATASLSGTAKEPTAKFEFDEFGTPKKGSAGRYGWLGGAQRRTELPSGVTQMGVRSYVPSLGRFISSDPIRGGSANAYDYSNADPVNGFDFTGESPGDSDCYSGYAGCQCKMWAHMAKGSKRGTLFLTVVRKCNRFGGITLQSIGSQWSKRGPYSGGWHDISAPQRVYPAIEAACTGITDPCQNYQKSQGLYYCEPGKEYGLHISWSFVFNFGGEGAEHFLDISVDQTCPSADT